MEQDLKDPQFDSALGGEHPVPNELNVSDFIKHRMEEVVMLTEAIEESPFRGQAFQRLPKHMRRRQMSHYLKRLPRRLQRPYLMSLKDGPPAPTKRPSRKHRRRPANLLLEYNRRQRNTTWLETHIWHAKRFHMTTKWGYKLPEKPVNKSFKACYRAISEHCLLLDKSFYNCIELKGPENELLEGLKRCTSPDCGPTFGAKLYLAGTREGHVTLFHPNSSLVVGNVAFMWQPGEGERKIWIWVHPQVHDETVDCFRLLFDLSDVNPTPDVVMEEETPKPSTKRKKGDKASRKKIERVKLEPKNVPFVRTPKFANKLGTVVMTLLKDTLNRFQVVGPLSWAVVSQAFTVAEVKPADLEIEFLGVESKRRKMDEKVKEDVEKKSNWWERYYNIDANMKNWQDQKNLATSQCSGDVPPGMILALVIEDPRLRIPAKRQKATVKGSQQLPVTAVSPSHSQSPIWIPEIRDEVSLGKLTTQQINEARSKKIVPGCDVGDVIPDEKQSRVPVLLVHRPGKREPRSGKLGLGSGWDIISPAGFGMPIWLSLVFRGARTGGIREWELLQLECNDLKGYLQPDSLAGEVENRQNCQRLRERYFKLPPNKRPNFVKLGVPCPFYLPWKALIRDWTGQSEAEPEKFCVLRDRKAITELSEIVNRFTKSSPDCNRLCLGKNCLVPVVVECSGRGKPRDMALICLPEDDDFRNSSGAELVEPPHADENEKSRKVLRSEHLKLMKSLKRKRKKERAKLKEDFANKLPDALKWKDILKTNSAPSEESSKEYNQKMEQLWLPNAEEVETVAGTCSRRILGFVVKGGFSYSRSHGLGLGYVTLPGLIEVFRVCSRNKSKVTVLVRNANQVQYRFARLKIAVE